MKAYFPSILFIIFISELSFTQTVDSVEYKGDYYYLFIPYSDNAMNMWNTWDIRETKSFYYYPESEHLPDGKWIQFFETKNYLPAKIFELKKDTLDGYYKEFNIYGVLSEEGVYENGERIGHWIYRDVYGELNSEGKKGIRIAKNGYTSSIYIGEWKRYFSDGNIESIEHYNEEGDKIGVWSYYYGNGQLKKEENYVKDELEGYVSVYYPNGQLKSRLLYVRINANFTEIKDSTYTFYYENGNISERGQMINGLRNGLWEEWYENGVRKSKGNYISKQYVFCGIVPFDVDYLLKVGKWTYWHSNGKKMAQGEYEFGMTNIPNTCEGGADITTFFTTKDWEFWNENGKEVTKSELLNRQIWKEDYQPLSYQSFMWSNIRKDNWEDTIPPGY